MNTPTKKGNRLIRFPIQPLTFKATQINNKQYIIAITIPINVPRVPDWRAPYHHNPGIICQYYITYCQISATFCQPGASGFCHIKYFFGLIFLKYLNH